MQDIHSLVDGRIFGAATSGDRRLRPLHHHHQHHHSTSNHHHNQQALKCPRCDSLNTKFCYYNNYNLSQPRHFCKSCRRYWTKGGVLRNVPVGGGCRKNKRSKPKNSSSSSNNNPSTPAFSAGETPQTTAAAPPLPVAEPKSSPPSSSESSSVTGTEAAVSVSAPALTSVPASEILGMSELRSVVPASADPNTCGPVFEHALLEQLGTAAPGDGNGIFTETNGNGGGFTGLMMTSWNEPFSNGILLSNQQNQWFHEDKLQGISGGFLDQTVENRSGEENSGFGALDWQADGGDNDQGLFDLPNTVDQAYWSHTQWTDQDNTNLYLP